MNDIILKLEQLGFSPYEAKAYYALIRKHPANGYEVGKIGKIPSAKIYETLHRLKIRGVITESMAESGKYYPIPPKTLLANLRQDFSSMVEDLESQLKQIEPLPDIDVTLNFSGYETFVEKARAVINHSNTFLLVSIWPEEDALLHDAITKAKERGVTVIAGVFGSSLIAGQYINLESCGASSHSRLGKRLNVIIADSTEVTICEIDDNRQANGVWTTTPSIVLVAKEYIKHDMWGNVLISALGEKKFAELCQENPLLQYLIKNR